MTRNVKYILLLISITIVHAHAQNCNNTSVGFPPIQDLGTGYWRGEQGGLYPNGSNFRPATHNAAGLNIAQNILPLDTNGNVDLVNGKIVWLSVGMSNTSLEAQFFIPMADTFAQKNPKLVLIDGAQGGQDIDSINNPTAHFWDVISHRLNQSGLTNKQVQAIWFKQAQKRPTDTDFTTYPDTLKLKFKSALQIAKSKFPNTQLAYLSNRIYGGYATTPENPEPYAYYSGWSVKRLIEDQINGDTSLAFSGTNTRVPWLAWGPNLWADGIIPRSDGLTWNCPTDFKSDGTHPSLPGGQQKVANLLLNFFTTDSTSVPWFLISGTTGISNTNQTFLSVYPNPANTEINISLAINDFDVEIINTLGETILMERNKKRINVSGFSKGIYFVKVNDGDKFYSQKFIKQ